MKNVKWKSENAKRVAALAVSLLSVMVSAADYNVRDFGAKGDGAAKDTAAIQSAIDTATAKGGGRVVFADGTFLSDALRLKSGVELHIDRTATLLASPDIADFPELRKVVAGLLVKAARRVNAVYEINPENDNAARVDLIQYHSQSSREN